MRPVRLEALAEVAERALVDRREFLAFIGPELLLPVYMWRLIHLESLEGRSPVRESCHFPHMTAAGSWVAALNSRHGPQGRDAHDLD